MGTRKAKAMASGPRHYNRVTKTAKHKAPDAEDHEVITIGRWEMDSRLDNCCADKKWRLLSTTGKLCDVNGFHYSYKAITNVSVGRSATSVVHDDGNV